MDHDSRSSRPYEARTGTLTTTRPTTVTWRRPDGSVATECAQPRGEILYHGGAIRQHESRITYPFAHGWTASVPATDAEIRSAS